MQIKRSLSRYGRGERRHELLEALALRRYPVLFRDLQDTLGTLPEFAELQDFRAEQFRRLVRSHLITATGNGSFRSCHPPVCDYLLNALRAAQNRELARWTRRHHCRRCRQSGHRAHLRRRSASASKKAMPSTGNRVSAEGSEV